MDKKGRVHKKSKNEKAKTKKSARTFRVYIGIVRVFGLAKPVRPDGFTGRWRRWI